MSSDNSDNSDNSSDRHSSEEACARDSEEISSSPVFGEQLLPLQSGDNNNNSKEEEEEEEEEDEEEEDAAGLGVMTREDLDAEDEEVSLMHKMNRSRVRLNL
eukprot:jgi/Bigna1/147512/aug1.179_g22220